VKEGSASLLEKTDRNSLVPLHRWFLEQNFDSVVAKEEGLWTQSGIANEGSFVASLLPSSPLSIQNNIRFLASRP
jgi:hypothetical protein